MRCFPDTPLMLGVRWFFSIGVLLMVLAWVVAYLKDKWRR